MSNKTGRDVSPLFAYLAAEEANLTDAWLAGYLSGQRDKEQREGVEAMTEGQIRVPSIAETIDVRTTVQTYRGPWFTADLAGSSCRIYESTARPGRGEPVTGKMICEIPRGVWLRFSEELLRSIAHEIHLYNDESISFVGLALRITAAMEYAPTRRPDQAGEPAPPGMDEDAWASGWTYNGDWSLGHYSWSDVTRHDAGIPVPETPEKETL